MPIHYVFKGYRLGASPPEKGWHDDGFDSYDASTPNPDLPIKHIYPRRSLFSFFLFLFTLGKVFMVGFPGRGRSELQSPFFFSIWPSDLMTISDGRKAFCKGIHGDRGGLLRRTVRAACAGKRHVR